MDIWVVTTFGYCEYNYSEHYYTNLFVDMFSFLLDICLEVHHWISVCLIL